MNHPFHWVKKERKKDTKQGKKRISYLGDENKLHYIFDS